MNIELFTGIKHGECYKHYCNRCSYQWVSHKEFPIACANKKCRSQYWNKVRQRLPKALFIGDI